MPTEFLVDTIVYNDEGRDKIRAILHDMNSDASSWHAAFEPDAAIEDDETTIDGGSSSSSSSTYNTGSKDEVRRYFTAVPMSAQAQLPSTNDQVRRVTIDVRVPFEGFQGGMFAAWIEIMKQRSASGQVNSDFVRSDTLYLPLDTAALLHHIHGESDERTRDAFKKQALHAIPLSVKVLDACNSTGIGFRARIEFFNPRLGRYVAMSESHGVCNGRSIAETQLVTTLESGTRSGSGFRPPELAFLHRLHGAHTTFNQPDMSRWFGVDIEALKEKAKQYRYKDGQTMHFAHPDDADTVLFPKNMVEYVFYAHAREIQAASLRCEAIRRQKLAALTQRERSLGLSEPLVTPIEPPRLQKGKKDSSVHKWVVSTQAFEAAIDHLAETYCSTDYAVNLCAPIRVALTPCDPIDGWKALAVSSNTAPAKISMRVELVFADAVTNGDNSLKDARPLREANRAMQVYSSLFRQFVTDNTPKFP
jgi:hypothetical protein